MYSAISGFHDTVEGELHFYCGSDPAIFKKMAEIASGFGLNEIWDQNPFSRQCSGGQEAVLTILCRLALGRSMLGLDICVEQLSYEARALLYNSVIPVFPQTRVLVVDNRLRELFPKIEDQSRAEFDAGGPDFSMRSNGNCSNGAALALHHLSFGYRRNKPIFRDCSFSFSPGIYWLKGANGSGKSTFANYWLASFDPKMARWNMARENSSRIEVRDILRPTHFRIPTFNYSLRACDLSSRILDQTMVCLMPLACLHALTNILLIFRGFCENAFPFYRPLNTIRQC